MTINTNPIIIRPGLKHACCDDDACRAAIYNQLLYSIAWKKKTQGQDFWYGTGQEMWNMLDRCWGLSKVNKEMRAIVDTGFIAQRHNPLNSWDQTWQYLFTEEVAVKFRDACYKKNICPLHQMDFCDDVVHLLKSTNAFGESNKCICWKQQIDLLFLLNRFVKSNDAIPKDTTKDTSEDTEITEDTHGVVATATNTTLSLVFDIDNPPDFSHVKQLPVVRQWLQSPTLVGGNTRPHDSRGKHTPPLSGVGDSSTSADESTELNPVIVRTTEARDVVTPSLPYDETPAPEIDSQRHSEGVIPTEVTRNAANAKQDTGSYSRSSAINDENEQGQGKNTRKGRGSGTRKTEQPAAPEPEKPKGPPPMPASDVSLSAEVLVQIMEAKKGRRYSDTTRSQELNVAKKLLKMEYEDAPISREQMEEAIDDMLSWSLWKTIPTKPMLKHLQKDDKILNILDELKKKPRKKPSSSSNGSSQQNLANQALDEDERRKQIDAKNKANLEKLRQRHAAMQQKSAQKGA